jgi:hypothetical protein
VAGRRWKCGLQMGEVVQNLRRGPVLRADELAPDLSLAIDDEGLRKAKRSVKRVAVLLLIADGQEVDPMLGQKLPVGAGIFVDIHAQHYQLRHLALQLVERRNLLNAWSTPTGPEIENNHLAPVGAELQAAPAFGDGKIRRRPSHLVRVVAPVAAGGKLER